MYLNAFRAPAVAGTSLFGQLPGVAGEVAQRFAGGAALQQVFCSALLHVLCSPGVIKSSIGIWWEKAQGSLGFCSTRRQRSIFDLGEVLPGAVVSTVW